MADMRRAQMNMKDKCFLQYYIPVPLTLDLYFMSSTNSVLEKRNKKLDGCVLYVDATGHLIRKK